MSKVFGIDLGTTNSVIATLDDSGQAIIIQNLLEGKDTLPSVVYFEDGQPVVVGGQAISSAEIYPDRVIKEIKRDIGKTNGRTVNFNGTEEGPIEISAYILKRLADYAKDQNYDVKDVVITVPAYFGIPERNATRQAGIMAGFNEPIIVNEPTAAAIFHCHGQIGNKKIFVYDLGGGTFDISIIDMTTDSDGVVQIKIIDTGGNDELGGTDWNKRLSNYMKHEYAEQEGISVDDIKPNITYKIETAAETVKFALSQMMQRNISIPSMKDDGEAVRINITRDKFNEITADLVDQTITKVNELLEKANLKPDDIDTVLLVGGSTNMPIIKEKVAEIFPGENKVYQSDSNLAVAKGAALLAKITLKQEEDSVPGPVPGPEPVLPKPELIVIDILPRSVGVLANLELSDGKYYNAVDNLLYKGAKNPATNTKDDYFAPKDGGFTAAFFENNLTVEGDLDDHYIKIQETDKDYNKIGDQCFIDDTLANRYIGELNFMDAEIKSDDEIIVKLDLSLSGLWADVTHKKTGKTDRLDLTSATLRTKEEVTAAKERIKRIGTTG